MKLLIVKNNNGFSLLETIVAISILMITIVGPLALASKGIVFADYVKDEITGFYLAQEAIESIRNIRDTNIKNNIPTSENGWLKSIKDKCMSSDGLTPQPCKIEIWNYNDPTHGLEKCTGTSDEIAQCERLNVVDIGAPGVSGANPDTIRLYGYDFGGAGSNIIPSGATPSPSIFTRKITVTNITDVYKHNPAILPAEQSLLNLDATGIDEINVTVEVDWVRSNNPRSVKVSENMFSI